MILRLETKWILLCLRDMTPLLMVRSSTAAVMHKIHVYDLHTALSWTLYLLAKHPEHQERCREEVRSVLQGKEQLE